MQAPPVRDAPGHELALRFAGVTRHFRSGFWLRRTEVLRGVDLAVRRGETLGLAGPNGSGKSTLLRIAAGVLAASTGQVEILGLPWEAREARRRSGYMPDDAPFPGELSALAALTLCASLQGLPRRGRRARAVAMLEQVGLGASAGKRLERFSGGMLRRFSIAQAFLHEPELVLLDEPTAGLDAQGYEVLAALLAAARARGAALVLCSHQLGDLVALCDRVALLLAGRVALEGAPAALFAGGTTLSDHYRRLAREAPE